MGYKFLNMPKKAEKKESTNESSNEIVEKKVVVQEAQENTTNIEEITPTETIDNKLTLSDFDWHNYEEGIDQVDDKQIKEFEKLVEENFVETLLMMLLREQLYT